MSRVYRHLTLLALVLAIAALAAAPAFAEARRALIVGINDYREIRRCKRLWAMPRRSK